MNPWRRRHPVIAPVFLQQRPEDLIEILAAAANGAPEHALLHRTELAQRAVAASVLRQHAGLEAMRAKRAERERTKEARGVEKQAAAARGGCDRTLPLRRFECRIELPHLREADDGSRGGGGDREGDGKTA